MRSILIIALFAVISTHLQSQHTDSRRIIDEIVNNAELNSKQKVEELNSAADQLIASDLRASRDIANQALTLAIQHDDKSGIAQANLALGRIHSLRAEFTKSLEYALSSLRIFESLKDKEGVLGAMYLLTLIYMDLHDNISRDEYFERSLALAQEIKNNEKLAELYFAKGTWEAVGKPPKDSMYSQTLSCYFKALNYIAENDKALVKPSILVNIGQEYYTLEDGDSKANLETALSYIQKGLSLARKQNNKIAEISALHRMGVAYKNKAEYKRAEEFLTEAERLAKSTGSRKFLYAIYISLIELKQITKDDIATHDYQRKFSHAQDSIFKIERAQKISELEAKFESGKKEEVIQTLEREKKIESIWRNVLLVGVIFTIGVSYLIFRLQRSRNQKVKQLLAVQKAMTEKLTEIDKMKSNFFANISHEFRTPLTLILAPLEELLKKKTGNKEHDSLLLIKRNANRLLELINQLLDLSKLEAGKMELRIKEGDLKSFITILANSFDSLAEYKELTYIKNIDILDETVLYDSDKIEKIVINLLANAFKFTPPQGRVIFTTGYAQHNNQQCIQIKVEDTGNGIREDEQEKIFNPFYQIVDSGNNFTSGTGLGLPLVRELVKLYNGTITLDSKVGLGTTFTAIIPISKEVFTAEQLSGNHYIQSPGTSREPGVYNAINNEHDETVNEDNDTILVIEDNDDLRSFICSVLKTKYNVLGVKDGAEAIPITFQTIPSLILSDLMMPKVDGIQVTEKIKTDHRTSHIPVILLTAKNEQQSRLTGLKIGADDYLTKPFSTEEILVRIDNLIEQRKKLAEKFREKTVVLSTPTKNSSLDDMFLFKVREVIESNLSNYAFSVEQLADEVHLSRTQLLRKLKALTSLSPNELIRDLRLKRAANMISQRADTITQIGYAVGFNDQSYFTKCFKKQFGTTPTEYAARFHGNNNNNESLSKETTDEH